MKLGRHEAPVLTADVSSPVFCVQGQFSNGRGVPQLVEWMAVFAGPSGQLMVDDLFATLGRAGVGPLMPNDGRTIDLDPLSAQLTAVVDTARRELQRRRETYDAELNARLVEPAERLARWADEDEQLALGFEAGKRSERGQRRDDVRTSTRRVIERSRTTGQPLIRVLVVLVAR